MSESINFCIMGYSNVIANIYTSSVVKIASEVYSAVIPYLQITYMEKAAEPVNRCVFTCLYSKKSLNTIF